MNFDRSFEDHHSGLTYEIDSPAATGNRVVAGRHLLIVGETDPGGLATTLSAINRQRYDGTYFCTSSFGTDAFAEQYKAVSQESYLVDTMVWQ